MHTLVKLKYRSVVARGGRGVWRHCQGRAKGVVPRFRHSLAILWGGVGGLKGNPIRRMSTVFGKLEFVDTLVDGL